MRLRRIAPAILVCMLMAVCASAQAETAADILVRANQPGQSDSMRVALTLKAGRRLRATNVDSAFTILYIGRDLAVRLEERILECEALNSIAELHRRQGAFKKAFQTLDTLIQKATALEDKKVLGDAYSSLGSAHSERGNYKEAAENYQRSNSFYERIQYDRGLSINMTCLANLYYLNKQFDLGKSSYHKALGIQRRMNDSAIMSATMISLGQLYFDIGQVDSAQYYNMSAYEIVSRLPNQSDFLFETMLGGYEYAMAKGQRQQAKEWLQKAEALAEAQRSDFKRLRVISTKGAYASATGDKAAAIRYMKEAVAGLRESGHMELLKTGYLNLAELYEETGDLRNALDMLVLYSNLKDSLYTAETTETINELNLKYETAEKETALLEKAALIDRKDQELKFLYIATAVGAIMLILLSVIIVQSKRSNRLRARVLKEEKEKTHLNALISGEEKERNRIARELHDGLGGILAASQMKLSNIQAVQSDMPALKETEVLVANAALEARRIAHNLLPATLMRLGLDEAMKEYCRQMSDQSKVTIEYDAINLRGRLQQHEELAVYRIIQELLNNIIKHAAATHALIQLHLHQGVLHITVEDDGVGLRDSGVISGIGLDNIQSRINYLNGTFNIRSDKGKGTSAYIEIPIQS